MPIVVDMAVSPYWLGDQPAPADAVITDELGNAVNLTGATITAELINPGTTFGAGELTVTVDDAEAGEVTLTWPEDPFTIPGIGAVRVRVVAASMAGWAEPVRFPILTFDGWLTLEQARQSWSDAPKDDLTLAMVLLNSKTECARFLAAANGGSLPLPVGAAPPTHWVGGQLLQAQAIWQVAQTNADDQIGTEGFGVRVFPLDWNIKQILRPKSAVPFVS